MQSFNDFCSAVTSYVAAFFALAGTYALDHSPTWIAIGGFVLLIARLIVEVPKAYRILIPKGATGEQGKPGIPGPAGPPGDTVVVTVNEQGQVIPNRKWWKFGWH